MEHAENSQETLTQQSTQYYTQDHNTGAEQIYCLDEPAQPLPEYQLLDQDVQAPVPIVQIQQQPRPIFQPIPGCPKCFGVGFCSKTFGLRNKPCPFCCKAAGVCFRCAGTGQSRRGRPCKNCAFHSNAGKCPLCTLKKALSGRRNRPCLICKTYQRIKY